MAMQLAECEVRMVPGKSVQSPRARNGKWGRIKTWVFRECRIDLLFILLLLVILAALMMVALYHISNKLDVCTNTANQAQLMNDNSNKLDVCTNTVNQTQLMKDWILYNGTCYYFSEEKEDWESSKKQCAMMGAQLAVLSENHIHENTKRFSKFPDDYWCGLHRVNKVWHWLNEPLKENVTISDYPDMNCGTIVLNGNGYNANDCNTKKLFVCTKSAKERI